MASAPSSTGALIVLEAIKKSYNIGQPSEAEVLHGLDVRVEPGGRRPGCAGGTRGLVIYLDTSAVAKLVVEEAESAQLAAWLDSRPDAPSSPAR